MNAHEACLRARAAWERTQSQMTLWPDVGLEETPATGAGSASPRARHSPPPAFGRGGDGLDRGAGLGGQPDGGCFPRGSN